MKSWLGAFTATAVTENVAVTVLAASTLVSVQVAPTQSPLKPLNVKPAAGVAVHVLVPPSFTGLGVHVTVPPLTGLAVAVIAKVVGATTIGAKVAVTLCAARTLVSVQVAPVQSPLKPLKVKPAAGVAVQVLEPPWVTGLGVQLTVPPLAGLAVAVISKVTGGIGAKLAVTVMAACTLVSVHVAPTQSPLKALKVKPAAGVAVHVLVSP